jgi:hypothetical protein
MGSELCVARFGAGSAVNIVSVILRMLLCVRFCVYRRSCSLRPRYWNKPENRSLHREFG